MRVLFATNGCVAGHRANVEIVNGKNVAVLAMGLPFAGMFKDEYRPERVAEIVYSQELINTQHPDLRGVVVAVEGEIEIDRAEVILAHAWELRQYAPLGLHLVAEEQPDWLSKYQGKFHPVTNGKASPLNAPRMMRYILERYLATGQLSGRYLNPASAATCSPLFYYTQTGCLTG